MSDKTLGLFPGGSSFVPGVCCDRFSQSDLALPISKTGIEFLHGLPPNLAELRKVSDQKSEEAMKYNLSLCKEIVYSANYSLTQDLRRLCRRLRCGWG